MQGEARSLRQPCANLRMLVGRVVVDDEVQVEIARHVGLDVFQEAQELLVAMAGSALRHDLSVGDVERGKSGKTTSQGAGH